MGQNWNRLEFISTLSEAYLVTEKANPINKEHSGSEQPKTIDAKHEM